jgi:hypothetical protein
MEILHAEQFGEIAAKEQQHNSTPPRVSPSCVHCNRIYFGIRKRAQKRPISPPRPMFSLRIGAAAPVQL